MDRFLQWFLKNFFHLFLIPISILSVIFGMYGHVLDNEIRFGNSPDSTICICYENNDTLDNNYNSINYSISSFIKFLNNQISLNSKKIEPQNKVIKENSYCEYNHLIILDRTQSTIDNELDNRTSFFRYKLIDSLKSSVKIDSCLMKLHTLPIKQLVVLSLYKSIKETPGSYCYSFYDGDRSGLKFLKNEINPEKSIWHDCKSNSSRIDLIERLNKESITIKTPDQQTNFLEIFSEIKNLDTTNFVLTIISDFVHELGPINETVIEELQRGNNRILQFNIIYLPPSDSNKRKMSRTLINFLNEKFKGVINYVEINVEDNSNGIINDDTYANFNNKRKQCFASFQYCTSDIKLFYPKNDYLSKKVAKCRIRFPNAKNPYWRITSKYPTSYDHNTFGYFAYPGVVGNSTFSVDGNWHPFSPESHEIMLNLNLHSTIENNELLFDVIEGNQTFRYNLRIVQYIPWLIAKVGIISVFTLLFMYFLLIGSHLRKNNRLLSNPLRDALTTKSYIEELLLLGLSFLFVYIAMPGFQLFSVICYAIIIIHVLLLITHYLYDRIIR